ncbi:MAG: acyltransferase family protein [Pseudomonadota bacterium]
MSSNTRYLPDIDGLRAIAVLAVVLFHLDIELVAGGYIGVDVFFVVSGFLITGIITDAIKRGDFQLLRFYANRVRRLYPALIATVAGTLLAAVWIVQPLEFKSLGQTAAAAIASVSNLVFFSQAGYWDAASELKPLLHTWSLGVEEQFYLIWPATLIVLARFRTPAQMVLVFLFLVVSLTACIVVTTSNQPAAFYLTPMRFWQFLLGALTLALWRQQPSASPLRRSTQWLGVVIIVLSTIVAADPSEFPGWVALLPSVGTAIVLFGISEHRNPLLCHGIARWLGKVSYSLYLVHWPVVSLYKNAATVELSVQSRWVLGLVMLILTVILHYGVETRFYRRSVRVGGASKSAGRNTQPLWPVGIVAVLAAGLGIHAWQGDGWRWRYPNLQLSAEDIRLGVQRRWSDSSNACQIADLMSEQGCVTPPQEPVLVLGNSHEPDGYNFLRTAAPELPSENIVVFGTTNGCGELIVRGAEVSATNAACNERLAALQASFQRVPWRAVVYSANHPFHNNKVALLALLEALDRQQPEVRIITIGGYFNTVKNCAHYTNEFATTDACAWPEHVQPVPFDPELWPLWDRFSALTDHYLDRIGLLCGELVPQSCLTQTPDGIPVFYDQHHMSYEFARMAGEMYARARPNWFSNLLGGAPMTSP